MNLRGMTVSAVQNAIEGHEYVYEYEQNWGPEKDRGKKQTTIKWSDWDNVREDIGNTDGRDVPGLGNLQVLDNSGGEGEGDDYHFVIRIEDTEDAEGTVRYFRKDGRWDSYAGGHYYGDLTEVFPEERVITVYV